MRTTRRVWGLLAAILVTLMMQSPHGAYARGGGAHKDPPFVLGMGDSIAWGFQAFPVDPNTTYPGFVSRFAARLAGSPHQQATVVNYACNGESTGSLIAGVPTPSGLQCAGKALYDTPAHDDYNGTQLDAAVAFLQQQEGEGIVLLNIGGNDPLDNPTVAACDFEPDCLTQAFLLPSVRKDIHWTALKNYKTILSTLLATNSRVRILVLTTYELDANDNWTTTGILDVLNAALADAIRAVGSPRVTVVDTSATFTPAAVCAGGLTEWCVDGFQYQSVHPTDAGYVTLTDLACDASRASTTRENHLKCRPGAYPKPAGHGKPKPEHPRPPRRR